MWFFRVFLFHRLSHLKWVLRSSTLSKTRIQKQTPKKFPAMHTNPSKKSKRTLFIKSKKCTKKHFLFKISMFSNVIDLLNYYFVNKISLIFTVTFCPLEFFENRTLKWVALVGFWIKIIFLIFFIHFAPRGTNYNLTFLNTQNRPTTLFSSLYVIL